MLVQNPTEVKGLWALPTQLSLPQLILQLCFIQAAISKFILEMNTGNRIRTSHYSQCTTPGFICLKV